MKSFLERVAGPVDGRDIDPELGLLEGEAAGQRVSSPDRGHPPRRVLLETPTKAILEGPSYYGLPLLKEPVWLWSVPVYFWVGGIAGGAELLAAAGHYSRREELSELTRRARWVSLAGNALGAGLLTYDLGRPARFHHMLRVFRPTSPMSVGAWILALGGALSGASALLAGRPRLSGLASAASAGAALIGMPLAGYTGVLLANTAVPVWQTGERALPLLFMASGVASAGSLLELLATGEQSERAAHTYANLGKAAELAAAWGLERSAGKVKRVGRPLRRGLSGTLWKAARLATVSSLVLSLAPTRRGWVRKAAAVLGSLGSLALRFAVMEAGKASARDPRASFAQQRAGRGAAAVLGRGAPRPRPLPEPVVEHLPRVHPTEASEVPAPPSPS